MKVLLCAEDPTVSAASLDAHIIHLERLKFEVVVVLSGTHSEQLLRGARRLEHCEIVFDTHPDGEIHLSTSLHAGVHCTEDAALVMSSTQPLMAEPAARELIKRYFNLGFTTPYHALWLGHGPYLITRSGNAFFRKAAHLHSLNDPAIQLLHIQDSDLASRVNTL
jgi:hypothetical protein